METVCKDGVPASAPKRLNVYEQTQVRLEKIFNAFDNVYVSFSGGKDSSALLYMCIEYVRKYCPGRKLGVFHMDYEVQYNETIRFVDEVLASNRDILDVYRVCVPFKVPTCTSMHQRYWRPWDEEMKEGWVREMPAGAYTYKDFPFFSKRMWDYDFQHSFARWLHERKGAKRTCCLVGIRTQESLHRWRTVNHRDSFRFHGWKWARRLDPGVYNVYPIYDWLTTDVWIANGKFHWPYNHLYDLYYQAGVPLEKQRVASPFLSEARSSLSLYRVIDPDMWGRMVNRVNGVNFTAIYATTSAVGVAATGYPAERLYLGEVYALPAGYVAREHAPQLPEQAGGEHPVLAGQGRGAGGRDDREVARRRHSDYRGGQEQLQDHEEARADGVYG